MAFSMAFRMACYCANTIMWMSRNGGKDRKNKGTLRYNFSDERFDADFN